MELTKSQSVGKAKCPQCRKGNIFVNGALSFKNPFKSHTHCPNCQLKYEIEPGFFWGAMYISYAISVALYAVVIFAVYLLVDDAWIWDYLIPVIIVTIIAAPFSFRASRVLLIHYIAGIKYKPNL